MMGTTGLRMGLETQTLVMCWLWLGLKAPALAWLEAAWAWQNHRPGQKPKEGLGLAWLWLRPGLFDIINTSLNNIFFYMI